MWVFLSILAVCLLIFAILKFIPIWVLIIVAVVAIVIGIARKL